MVRLRPLQDIEEQLEILETRSGRENVKSDADARKLVERLAGLPLALATAGAYLRRRTFSFGRYLQEYERNWNFYNRWPAKLPEYDRTLYTTWEVSFNLLKREDDRAAQLLGLLAYFSNQRLWYGLFQAGLSNDLPEWLQSVVSSDIPFKSAMGMLTDYCFLEVQATSLTWSMHTCVHGWTLAALNQTIDERQYWYAFDCVGALAKRESFQDLANIRLSDLTSHALRLEYVCRHESDVIGHVIPSRVDSAVHIAELSYQQVQLGAAEEMYMRALKGYEEALGPKHTSTLDTVNNLGNLYSDQGKLEEAEEMYMRASEGYATVEGDHEADISCLRDQLSVLRMDKSQPPLSIGSAPGTLAQVGPAV